MVYYGLRFYSTALGRFINRDPIEEMGGANLYAFCANGATNAIDTRGAMVSVPGNREYLQDGFGGAPNSNFELNDPEEVAAKTRSTDDWGSLAAIWNPPLMLWKVQAKLQENGMTVQQAKNYAPVLLGLLIANNFNRSKTMAALNAGDTQQQQKNSATNSRGSKGAAGGYYDASRDVWVDANGKEHSFSVNIGEGITTAYQNPDTGEWGSWDTPYAPNNASAQNPTVEILTFNPVGHGKSSFGHAAMNIDGTTYSFGEKGWFTEPTADYLKRNSFRDAVGQELTITPEQRDQLLANIKADMAANPTWNTTDQGCAAKVRDLLESSLNIPISIPTRPLYLSPLDLRANLERFGYVQTTNYYPKSGPP